MRTEPCKQCNMFDFYYRGTFSYCRPCHSQAQRRYAAKQTEKQLVQPPRRSLEEILELKNSFSRNKTHCVNGHPFSGDNVRYSSQKGGRNMFRRCRACERNAKRVKYGLAPEPTPMTLGKLLEE